MVSVVLHPDVLTTALQRGGQGTRRWRRRLESLSRLSARVGGHGRASEGAVTRRKHEGERLLYVSSVFFLYGLEAFKSSGLV